MNIQPISFSNLNSAFLGRRPKRQSDVDQSIQVSNWGSDYAFPVSDKTTVKATKEESKQNAKDDNTAQVVYSSWGDNYAYPAIYKK